jgi:hypothetical protein
MSLMIQGFNQQILLIGSRLVALSDLVLEPLKSSETSLEEASAQVPNYTPIN